MGPIVSVLMITYNHEKYIAQAIESVIMQKTNFDYEIVIGEDCSTDKTREIVLEYKARYPDKIKLLLQEKNVGMMQNFIDTFKACNGKYIALLEGDDYWTDPYKLQKQVDFLEANPEYSMCFTSCKVVNYKNNLLYEDKVPFNARKNLTQKDVLTFFGPPTATVLMVNMLKEFPQSFNKVYNGDIFLWGLITQHGLAAYLPINSAAYRISESGVWSLLSYEKKLYNEINSNTTFYNYFKPKYVREFLIKITHSYLRLIIFELKQKNIKFLVTVKKFIIFFFRNLTYHWIFVLVNLVFLLNRKISNWFKYLVSKLKLT